MSESGMKYAGLALLLVLSCNRAATPKPKEATFERRERCMELGLKVESDAQKGDSAKVIRFGGEFAYNPALDTCLYSGGYIMDDRQNQVVIDALSRKRLIEITKTIGTPEKVWDMSMIDGGPSTQEEFDVRAAELMAGRVDPKGQWRSSLSAPAAAAK